MRHKTLDDFIASGADALRQGPIALIFVEDSVEVNSTIKHHLGLGFSTILVFAVDDIAIDLGHEEVVHRIAYNPIEPEAVCTHVNRVIRAANGQWVFYCHNAEYLFYPFCETRSVKEMLQFHAEERRDAMLTYVIDLYADDLDLHPNAVSIERAHLDKSGYYALARKDPDANWEPKERQLDFFGGVRWRFEEHIPEQRRKIDRISLFRAEPELQLRTDHTLSDEEYNTYACPWHNNITAVVASFRTAKALKRNHGSSFDISTFQCRNSVQFEWHSQQLLDLGLMEPGQWC